MSLVRRLAWDSSFFGLEIGELAGDLAASQVAEAVVEADACGFDCVYLLVPAAADDVLDAAQRQGFRVRDARLTLERALDRGPAGTTGLRRANQRDLGSLAPIARERFQTTRFYADPGFSRERCNELYVAWLRRGVEAGPERLTLVPADGGGFIVVHLAPEAQRGTVELIGVAAAAERRGLGRLLVQGALDLFRDAGLTRARVVTQARNVAAQRLYQRHGFLTSDCAYWLHRWRDAS